MVELPHAVVGAVIATKIGNPALSLPLALASHYVLDLLPHWNPHLNRELTKRGRISGRTTLFVAADVVVSLLAGFYIASQALPDTGRFAVIIAGAFLAVLPDVIEGPYFFMGYKHPLLARLVKFQGLVQFNAPPLLGLATQILVLAAAFWWMLG